MNEATISGGNLTGTIKLVPGLGAAFHPLKHTDFPDQNLYRDGGLNFEHILNGTTADEKINWFTPRLDTHHIVSNSASSAAVIHKASESTWGMESQMTYTMSGGDAIDMEFRMKLHENRFPLGYVGFMWASYMNRTKGRNIRFYGELNGQPGWVNFGEDTEDDFETGTIAAVGVPKLPYEPESAILNITENEQKRFIYPFYYGLVDGDGDLTTTVDTMAYIMMFDQCESIRFAMWNFIEDDNENPDPYSPAWDWQYVIKNPIIGQWYSYRARMEYTRFINEEDILRRYRDWSKLSNNRDSC